jgi:hypothetical protein
MDVDRTYADTLATMDAKLFLEHDLIFPLQAFRIRTPATAERAAFEKYECPYTRAIIYRIFLYIEYACLSFQHATSFTAHSNRPYYT